jgi:hypothetical protein
MIALAAALVAKPVPFSHHALPTERGFFFVA